MADHDDLCPRKWHGVLQGAACGYCDMLRSAREEERERIAQAIDEARLHAADTGWYVSTVHEALELAARIARGGHE